MASIMFFCQSYLTSWSCSPAMCKTGLGFRSLNGWRSTAADGAKDECHRCWSLVSRLRHVQQRFTGDAVDRPFAARQAIVLSTDFMGEQSHEKEDKRDNC